MLDQIKLEVCPEVLRAAVGAELAKWTGYNVSPKIISCTASKPLETSNTTFKVYIMVNNTFMIMDYEKPVHGRYDFGVRTNPVTIGEIKEIIRAAPGEFI